MPLLAPVPPLPEVTVPLNLFIPGLQKHYFNRMPDRPYFTRRRFEFCGTPQLMPLVHAFLDTCAAAQSAEYRFLFDLLGTELAANAIRHTRSGLPGGTYVLMAERSTEGLTLTCQDDGALDGRNYSNKEHHHLRADPGGLDPEAESGRGLAMVDALATSWGDSGRPSHRHVWFFLAYDLHDSAWAAA